MRILVVHSFYRPSMPSGENDAVRSQVDLLRSSGHEVEVVGPESSDDSSAIDKASVGARVALGVGEDPTAVIRAFSPNLIHVHNMFPNISPRWLTTCDVPVAMTLHNYRTLCANGVFAREGATCTECLTGSRLAAVRHGCYRDSRVASVPAVAFQGRLRKVIREHVDLIVFPSAFSADIIGPHLPHRRSTLLPNYVPDIGVGPHGESVGDQPYFLVLGRLTPEKGVDRLIEMWGGERRLVVAGDGPQRSRLEEMARGRNVEFVGFVEPDRRDPLLRQARALILPSITMEADPVVIAQALSAGTACVAFSGTATARLATSTSAVRSYTSRDTLAAAIEDVEARDLRQEARSLYDRTWSADAWLHGYQSNVIRSIARGGGGE